MSEEESYWIPDPRWRPYFRISTVCSKSIPCMHAVENPPQPVALVSAPEICRILRVMHGRCTIDHFDLYDSA